MFKRKFAVKSIKSKSKVLHKMLTQLVYIPRVIIAAYIGLTLLITIVVPASAAGLDSTAASFSTPEVFGGENVEQGMAPQVVALVDTDIPNALYGQFCGGTLIAKNLVLTAAHCTFHYGEEMAPSEIDIVAGTVELSSNQRERIGVVEIIRHPDYDRSTAYADIAVLKLAGESSLSPAEFVTEELLAALPSLLDVGQDATVFGWGKTEERSRSNYLKSAAMPVIDHATCQGAYSDEGYVVADGTLCAGFAIGGQDACSGDSGGPLMIPNPNSANADASHWIQIGIVSWGEGCAEADSYGVYTSVFAYTSWLVEVMANQITVVDASGSLSNSFYNPVLVEGVVSPVVFIPLVQ